MGDFVFVVAKDSTAALRPVTVSYRYDNNAVIEKGVEAGERVIVDGQLRLRPGSPVIERQSQAGNETGAS